MKMNKKKGDVIENMLSSDSDLDCFVLFVFGFNCCCVIIDVSGYGFDVWCIQDISLDDLVLDWCVFIKIVSRKSIDVLVWGYVVEFWFCYYNEIYSNEG